MKRSRVVIEISQSRLEAALIRGRAVVAARAIAHDTPNWAERWPASLEPLAEPLSRMIEQLGARNLPAVIIASTPTGAVTIQSCPRTAGVNAARAAAILALSSTRDNPVDDGPSDTAILCTDRTGRAGQRSIHTLAASESDETATAIVGLARAAGLRPVSIIPADAASTALACRLALVDTGEQRVQAVLWLGEHHSVLAAGSPGELRIARQVSLGIEAMVEALLRPINRRDTPGEPITLTRQQARRLLIARGIPDRNEIIDESTGLKGEAVLPLLQPVLQRMAVEIKQSLRFGLAEEERAAINFAVSGPGARLRNFAAAMNTLAFNTEADQGPREQTGAADEANDELTSSRDGLIAGIAERPWDEVNLLPRELQESAAAANLSRSIRVGIAACMALLAAEATMTWNLLRDATTPIDRHGALSGLRTAAAQIDRAGESIVMLRSHIAARIGSPASTAAACWVAAEAAPRGIGVNAVTLNRADSGYTMLISGEASAPSTADATASVKTFMDALAASPIIRETHLRHTQRTESEGRRAQRFEVSAALVPLPSLAPGLTVAAAESEGRDQ